MVFFHEHLTPKTNAENMADKIRDGTATRGEQHGCSKLTNEKVIQIRARSTECHQFLATEFDVTRSTISNILSRRSWDHI